ncbi:unnamed protein product [Caretta caretta]
MIPKFMRTSYKQLSSITNVKIFRFNSSLYYPNKSYFRSSLYQKTGMNPAMVAAKQHKAQSKTKANLDSSDSCFSSRFSFLKPSKKGVQKDPTAAAILPIGMHTLVIDCRAMQFLDTVGLSVLKEMHHDYKEIVIQVLLANCNPSIRHLLQDGGWESETGNGELAFHSVHDAVQFAESQYQEQHKDSEEIGAAFLDNEVQNISEDPNIETAL